MKMGIFDKLKTVIKRQEVQEEPKAQPKSKKKSAKEIATDKGEPWVSVLSVELDPDNIGNGAFELDWNDKFITNLVRAGYQLKKDDTDAVMVDRWFADICKNVIAENYEQWEANQPIGDRPREINRKDIGDGRTEVS
jgi:hypothetical protein